MRILYLISINYERLYMLLATTIIILSYYITRDIYHAESFLIDQPEEKTTGEILFCIAVVAYTIIGIIINLRFNPPK